MTTHSDFQNMHDFVVKDLGVDEPVTIKENNGTAFVDHPSRAVVYHYKEHDLVSGGTLQLGDLKLIISATKWPAGISKLGKRDRIVVRGDSYGVIHFDKFTRTAGGSAVAYEVTIRG